MSSRPVVTPAAPATQPGRDTGTPAEAVAPGQQSQPAPACAQAPADEATCPACGATMRLWANYYRCRTCGFKESCCF